MDEDDLYAVMSFETGGTFDPAQKNLAGSGATGLIQFMPSTARGLGTSTAELAKMSRTEQLKYVDKYFSNKGIEGGNIDDLYMAILFPAAVGKPDNFVLFGKGAMAGYTGRAYDQNRGLDANNDGSITKAEAAASARKHKGRRPRPPSEVPSSNARVSQRGLPALPPTNTLPGKQHYGASRDGGRRKHAGVDFDAGPNDTFYSRIGGTVIFSGNVGGGYGNVVDVYNKELGVTERIAEGDVRLVKKGDVIAPGTPVQKGTHQTGVFHYEIRKGKAGASGSYEGTLNPTEFLKRMDTARPQPRKPPSEVPSSVSATPSYQKVAVAAPVEQPPATPIMIGGGGQQMVASGPSRRDLANRSSQVRFNSRFWSA